MQLTALGRCEEAMNCYRQTLRLDPNSAPACVNLANLCSAAGALDEAMSLLNRAIQLRPNFAEAHVNLASGLLRQRKFAEARIAIERAIRLKPDLPESYNDLGILQTEQGEYAAAAASFRRALALRSENADAIYNLGIALLKQKMVRPAIEQFDQALRMRPDFAEAHDNRSAALLLNEDYEQGWAEYEWRFRSRDFPASRFRWPRWDGGPLDGRTIVLCAEQGLGDTLQFIRYAPLVKQRGARVIVECPAALHAILARTSGVDAWISLATPPPPADYCVPMLSLPYFFGTTLETIPAEIPYVLADPDRVAAWRDPVRDLAGGQPVFKVGIAWQGNRRCPGDATRSIPLAALAPLAQVGGVRLISLQKGPGVEQLNEVPQSWSIVDFGDELDASGGAFMDTAAIMSHLDLVITSDTATAHLAGARGARVACAIVRARLRTAP